MAAPPIQFSTDDLRTPESTERVLRQFQDAIGRISSPPASTLPSLQSLAMQLAPLIGQQLQAGGTAPLNLQSLLPSTITGGVSIEDTNANRLALYTPPASAGLSFYETDRHVLYVSVLSSGSLVWQYAGGVYESSLSTQPANLTANDVGFLSYTTDTLTNYVWTGTAWTTIGGLYQNIQNSATSTITDIFILQHLLANLAGANGIGAGQLVQLVDDAKSTVDGGRVSVVATDARQAFFTTKWVWQLRSAAAALADWFEVLTTGIQFKVGSFFGIFTHANSADRTYMLPNATGNITYETAALTSGNFLFGGGGSLVADAGFSVVPIANGGTGSATGFTESTFTPGISFGGGVTGITYTAQVGRFRRTTTTAGDWITAEGYFLLSSKGSSTGTAVLTGLPVASINLSNFYQAGTVWCNTVSVTAGHVQIRLAPSATVLDISQLNTGTDADLDDTNFTNTSEISFSITYKVA